MDNINSTTSVVAGSLPSDFCPTSEDERLQAYASVMTVSQQLAGAGRIGEKGDIGEQGIQGDKGDVGEQGEQGIQGVQGLRGYTPCITFGAGVTRVSIPTSNSDFDTYQIDLSGVPDHIPVDLLDVRIETSNITTSQPVLASQTRTESPRALEITIRFANKVAVTDEVVLTYPIYNIIYQFKEDAPVDEIVEGMSCSS